MSQSAKYQEGRLYYIIYGSYCRESARVWTSCKHGPTGKAQTCKIVFFYILPVLLRRRTETTAGFYRKAGFLGVIGAIDCTLVPITNPGGETGELLLLWRAVSMILHYKQKCSAGFQIWVVTSVSR